MIPKQDFCYPVFILELNFDFPYLMLNMFQGRDDYPHFKKLDVLEKVELYFLKSANLWSLALSTKTTNSAWQQFAVLKLSKP